MIIFVDTEFTDLVIEPRLLSVGMVAGAGRDCEFYAEVTDRVRIHAASWFALDVVLPQFGRVAHAACSYATLGARVSVFLDRLISSLADDEFIDVTFSYDLDWELIEAALRDGGAEHSALARRKLRPRNIYDIVGFGPGKLAANNYFKSQEGAFISQHHSLCDARALRLAYNASAKSRTSEGVAEQQAGDPFRIGAAPSSLVSAATTMLAERCNTAIPTGSP